MSIGVAPGGSWLGYLLGGPSAGGTTTSSGSGTRDDVAEDPALEAARSEIQDNGALAVGEHVVVRRDPEVPQVFHPSDIINRYLLDKDPSANIAITHDDDWMSMLEENLLQSEDLAHEGRLETLVSQEYDVVSAQGAIYLQRQRKSEGDPSGKVDELAPSIQDQGTEPGKSVRKGQVIALEQTMVAKERTTEAKWRGDHGDTTIARINADASAQLERAATAPNYNLRQAFCDALEAAGDVTKAIECFRTTMLMDPVCDPRTKDERVRWGLDFQRRCAVKLEMLGDTALESKNYDAAIAHYSIALTLVPTNMNGILIKCCKVRAGFLEEELDQINRDIERDPSSYMGYKRKHRTLHRMGHYKQAFKAFEIMLSRMERSRDFHVRRHLRGQYFDATLTIRHVVGETIRDIPRVLIDIATGRLCDKAQQAAAFERLPIFDEIRSSMTTRVDLARIQTVVEEYYQYVMLSHKRQPDEPTLQTVENIGSIYALSESSAAAKLLGFCKLVRTLHFHWAWNDTCCINQTSTVVQQEAVIAMFRWYRGSALTIVHLLGVLADWQEFGCLWRSIWNTRGWTYPEYVASKVVQFYTEDWKPYLGLDMFNHKESPIILSEMERAMNFSTQQLVTLQPGLDRVREKLYLASRRRTTYEEDIAYSLFGVFNIVLPVIYGEGKQAVGRLLEHILIRSDSVTLLAWTGISGNHCSYLPADLTVYNQIVPPHIPKAIETAEMDALTAMLPSSLGDPIQSAVLYNQLCDLMHSIVVGRLRLPGIVFPVRNLSRLPESDSDPDLAVYRATTSLLGDVEIRTAHSMDRTEDLLLVNPWIGPILDYDFSFGAPRFDLETRALRLVVRLRQPFGALLLARTGRAQYRRVATDSLIMAQVREETSLTELTQAIRTVDVE